MFDPPEYEKFKYDPTDPEEFERLYPPCPVTGEPQATCRTCGKTYLVWIDEEWGVQPHTCPHCMSLM